jgi:hypothetical protein
LRVMKPSALLLLFGVPTASPSGWF